MSRSTALAYGPSVVVRARPGVSEDGGYRLLGAGYVSRDALMALDRQAWESGGSAYPWYEQADPQAMFEPRSTGPRFADAREAKARRIVKHPGWLLLTSVGLLFMAALVLPNAAGGRSPWSSSGHAPTGYGKVTAGAGVVAAPLVDASTSSQEKASAQQPDLAAPAPPSGSYDVTRAPSLSVRQIESVLQQYGSPAAGKGQALYDLGVRYGIDPIYALAFFVHESACGTRGVARFTHSLGNIRWTPGYDNYEGYRSYGSWEQGMEDWYKLITELYINGWQLRTVDAIIPVYAPYEDDNDPPAYIASVKRLVDSWRGK